MIFLYDWILALKRTEAGQHYICKSNRLPRRVLAAWLFGEPVI